MVSTFGDAGTQTSETHFVRCGGRLALGNLRKVHYIYRRVVHDEISAKKASDLLTELVDSPPIYSTFQRCTLAFILAALICPLSFGGSFIDMWIAAIAAALLCTLQLVVVSNSSLYASVFDITVTILISFTTRGLSSIGKELFCYTAISSASIVTILPGYLVLCSSLEIASRTMICGSVRMVYALVYTLFLGFGLQLGSDLYLVVDPLQRGKLASFGSALQRTVIYSCYRHPQFPWYLQPLPWWTQFLTVPLFGICLSLANLQPYRTKEFPVMVIIACVSYVTNKAADHYIFNRSEVVSAVGAFTVGMLGNIYSRKMGGTAFTSVVPGILFLVPSGLSQAGGMTADNGIDIGSAMINVVIGITVGLFISQTVSYMFGSRRNGITLSF
ncbi:hypothetical protein HETIRDRAFT_47486 [Heterobasidion irregulare TC 32-1]|uniref:Threonine/serine exporter-like N-terminal domain-containing protein n=1 Tax=Heterobasidion irregulare (strain TC 32-1) TaxID=747525 RepID=W4KDQ2_HETIT|nr:uncharacterized protein HETIRDRAFT_47486 [Heterobasidion irregulare TC 32-1]ETW83928.1 hypothetical protein HETIRDRAFT_47486 [Heterobasidion irregulare TC 32-1]